MNALAGLDRLLVAEGCRVVTVPGWETRGHAGVLEPDGALLHHTGGRNDLDTCINGRPDLAGPLCNLYVRRNGTVVLVAGGVAWHAGPGSKLVHGEILREQIVDSSPRFDAHVRDLDDDWRGANPRYIGVEVENTGSEPLTAAQIDVIPRVMAAVVRHQKPRGWKTAYRWRHHRQHTRRKPDMAHRGDLWKAANARLAPPPKPPVIKIPEGRPLTNAELVAAVAAEVRKQIQPDLLRLAQYLRGKPNSVFNPATQQGLPDPKDCAS